MNKSIIIILLFFLTTGCGYSIKNKSYGNNFNISEINLSGEKKINYKIKSKLLFADSDLSKNILTVDINTIKEKTIKSKNIKNEIISYYLTITTKVEYSFIGKVKKNKFLIIEKGDYKVSSSRLNTLNNEKNLVKNLTDNTIDKLISRLNSSANDS